MGAILRLWGTLAKALASNNAILGHRERAAAYLMTSASAHSAGSFEQLEETWRKVYSSYFAARARRCAVSVFAGNPSTPLLEHKTKFRRDISEAHLYKLAAACNLLRRQGFSHVVRMSRNNWMRPIRYRSR